MIPASRTHRVAAPIVSLLSGAFFGVGLVVAGMTDPKKVQGFLDPAGAWDPSLAFVMASAVLTCAAFSWLASRRAAPVLEASFAVSERRAIDSRLVSGAAVFGIGWGLCGVCPGSGIVSLGTANIWPIVFVAAMALGARAEGLLAYGGALPRLTRHRA